MRGLSLRLASEQHVPRPMSAGELLGSPPPRPRLYGLGLLARDVPSSRNWESSYRLGTIGRRSSGWVSAPYNWPH